LIGFIIFFTLFFKVNFATAEMEEILIATYV